MRTLILILIIGFGLFSSRLTPDCQAQVNVTLSWNPSTNGSVAGYDLVWGTNSGKYFASNVYQGNITTGTISNLQVQHIVLCKRGCILQQWCA